MGDGVYIIEKDGSIHELIFAGDAVWNDKEVGNILCDIFSKKWFTIIGG